MGEAMTAEALLARHAAAWQAAVVHPFLAGVRDGTVPEDSFDRWLAQDYLYAQVLVRAQSRIAAGAPFADVGLLAGGVVATVGELGWFEEMAARRGVPLDVPMHPTTRVLRLPAGTDLLRVPGPDHGDLGARACVPRELGRRPPRRSALPAVRREVVHRRVPVLRR
jgi:hypothetical protein